MAFVQADNPGVSVLGLTLDYFKPAPWLPMPVQYPLGLAMVMAAIALAAMVMRRWAWRGIEKPNSGR